MVIVKDKGNYLVTCRINLGGFFGVPEEDAFVELREADTRTSKRLSDAAKKAKAEGENSKMVDIFLAELPGLVVAHNFYNPAKEGQPEPGIMTSAEVIELLADRLPIFEKVAEEYCNNVLFTRGKGSEESSST
jgi:hypothetical protein